MKTLKQNTKVLLHSGVTAMIIKPALSIENGYKVKVLDSEGNFQDEDIIESDDIADVIVSHGGKRENAGRKKIKEGITTSFFLSKPEYIEFKNIYGNKCGSLIDSFIRDQLKDYKQKRTYKI